MRRISLLGMTALLVVGMAGVATAHAPPGEVNFVFQWPDSAIPQIDGDLSEWDVVPATYEITNPDLFQVFAAGPRHPEMTERGDIDPEDMFIRHRIGWNDNTNRLYFATSVFDDEHDRDSESNCLWDDDDWEVRVGPNIPWEEMNEGATDGDLNLSHFLIAVPPIEGGTVGITGYFDFFPWSTAADFLQEGNTEIWEFGWSFDGEMYGESTYYYELSYRHFEATPSGDPPSPLPPLVDLEEGDTYHINIMVLDRDPKIKAAGGKTWESLYSGIWSISPGPDNAPKSDFVMAPLEDVSFVTAISNKTWGQIKAGI